MTPSTPARTVLAVFLGYLTFLILEIAGAFAAAAMANLRTGGGLVISGELITFVSAVIGGAVTARVAQSRPLAHAGALGLAILTVTILVTLLVPHRAATPYPSWFPYATALLSGAGAFVGGALVSSTKPAAE